jgi:hypothetical protein
VKALHATAINVSMNVAAINVYALVVLVENNANFSRIIARMITVRTEQRV